MHTPLSLQSVKVFINAGRGPGAELAATCAVGPLATGTHTCVLGPLPKTTLPESLRLALPPGLRLVALSTRPTYQAPPTQPTDAEALELELEAAKIEERSLFDVLELLRGFQWKNLPGKEALDAVPEFLDWYAGRRLKLETDLEEVRRRLKRLQERLNALKATHAPTESTGMEAVALVQADADTPTEEWLLHYLVTGPSWKPTYDLHVDTPTQTAHAVLRARVANLSGQDWSDVVLMFSTKAPRMGLALPPDPEEVVEFREREELDQASPLYRSGSPQAKKSFALAAMAPPAPPAAAMPVFEVEEQLLNVTYTAAQPWTIASGATQHVDVQRVALTAQFYHLAVPLHGPSVYVAAEMKPETEAPLLEAEARIIVDGIVAGTTHIGSQLQKDGLRVALGQDEHVEVKRTVKNAGAGKSFMGGTAKQGVKVELSVTNGHRALRLRIRDRVPISHHRDIEVALEKAEGARHTPETGLLQWDLSLAPREERTLHFAYEVRHPAKQEINPIADL